MHIAGERSAAAFLRSMRDMVTTATEWERIQQLDVDGDRLAAFMFLWAVKEAVLKVPPMASRLHSATCWRALTEHRRWAWGFLWD